MKDTNLLVQQREKTGILESRGWAAKKDKADELVGGKKPTGRVRQHLEATTGRIEFTTGTEDGLVEICVQSMTASAQAPSRIGLRVYIEPPNLASITADGLVQKLTEHSSLISDDLSRMLSRVDQALIDADYATEREKEFREKSVSLNKAVKYWPLIRIVCLLSSGIIQARYIIQYMKSRHIY
jgi:hypothetical protein